MNVLRRFSRSLGLAVLGVLLMLGFTTVAHCTEAMKLQFEDLPQLPDKFGFGGPIVGRHHGVLIVAGGANFPAGPPWPERDRPAGSKVWHGKVFSLQNSASNWSVGPFLPRPLAYAPAISTPDGIYVLGGETYGPLADVDSNDAAHGAFPTAEVIRIRWDDERQAIRVDENALPPLPKPCSYHAAALIGSTIYVAASHAESPQSRRLDTKAFWALDLERPGEERRWIELPPWPGAARHKMALVAQWAPVGDQEERRMCLFLISGSTWVNDENGAADLAEFEHYADAFRYEPARKGWARIADLPVVSERTTSQCNRYSFNRTSKRWTRLGNDAPNAEHDLDAIYARVARPAVASPAIASGDSQVFVLSGDSGRFITMDLPDRPLFPTDILGYDTQKDRWSVVGQMPQGVVTTQAIRWRQRIVVPSGEIRPGVRTPNVQMLYDRPRNE